MEVNFKRQMKKQELVILDPKEFGIDNNKALELQKDLPQMLSERDTLTEAYDSIIRMEITPETSKMARELRLKIRDNRTKGIEPWHKTNKAYFLAAGKYLDAVKNREVEVNQRMEANLEEIEKVEEIARNKELDDRLETRLNRLKSVDPEGVHHGMRDLSDDVFEAYLMALEMRIGKAKEEADRLEKERLANEAKQSVFNDRRLVLASKGYTGSGLTLDSTEEEYSMIVKACDDLIAQQAAAQKEKELALQKQIDDAKAEAERLEEERLERAKIQHDYLLHKSVGFEVIASGDYFKEGYTINQKILGTVDNAEIKSMAAEIDARILKDKEQDRLALELKAKQEEEARAAKERAEKQAADLSKGDAERWEDMIKDIEFLKKKYDGKISDVKKLKQVGQLFDKISTFIKSC
jgi:hypothetical protein